MHKYFAILPSFERFHKIGLSFKQLLRHCCGFSRELGAWCRYVQTYMYTYLYLLTYGHFVLPLLFAHDVKTVQESLANAKVSARQPCTSKTDFDMK